MAGIVNSGSFSKALWPGINAWYGDAFDEWDVEHTALFDQFTSRRQYEEDVSSSGTGLLMVKPEGQAIQYDTMLQGFTTRYTHIEYALGIIITKIMVEDDQYDVVGPKRAKSLAFSTRQTPEVVGANVYNRAFNSSYTGGDGKSMIASDHPNIAGGTYSNTPTTAANLSEAVLEQACIDIARFNNDRGLKVKVTPRSIITAPDNEFELTRILKSQYRVGTPNNDINALMSLGKFPEGVKINHYLTSTTAWFIRTNVPDGLKHFTRSPVKFSEDNDWETSNAKFKVEYRDSFGWSEPRAIYGSAGV